MGRSNEYNGGLTREQFLFFEIRVVARLIIEGYSKEEILIKLKEENLFQFPTERMIHSIANTCFKRLDALESEALIHELAHGSIEVAKQVNLYAMMRYNRVVWDFMVTVIGEKYRTQDFEFSQKDLNLFFMRLQEQNDDIASWSETTINKIKQVLKKSLVECEYIDTVRSTILNPVYLFEELAVVIKENNDYDALPAFNCMEGT